MGPWSSQPLRQPPTLSTVHIHCPQQSHAMALPIYTLYPVSCRGWKAGGNSSLSTALLSQSTSAKLRYRFTTQGPCMLGWIPLMPSFCALVVSALIPLLCEEPIFPSRSLISLLSARLSTRRTLTNRQHDSVRRLCNPCIRRDNKRGGFTVGV